MKNMNNIQNDFVIAGRKTEKKFVNDFEQYGDYKISTPTQDRHEHWDIEVTPYDDFPNELIIKDKIKYYFDIKSIKSFNFYDKGTHEYIDGKTDKYQYIEWTNPVGKPGYIHSSVDYIIFETEENWLFIKTEVLRDYARPFFTGDICIFGNVLHGVNKRSDDNPKFKYFRNPDGSKFTNKEEIMIFRTSELEQITTYKLKKK